MLLGLLIFVLDYFSVKLRIEILQDLVGFDHNLDKLLLALHFVLKQNCLIFGVFYHLRGVVGQFSNYL